MRLTPKTEPEKCPYRLAWCCGLDENYPNTYCFDEFEDCPLYKIHMHELIKQLRGDKDAPSGR